MGMILLTGNKSMKRSRKSGLTFIEVMVTIVILSTGIVIIYKALLMSLDYQSHLTRRLYALNLLEGALIDVQLRYDGGQISPGGPEQDIYEVVLNNRTVSFQFTIDFFQDYELLNIWRGDAVLSWPERGRTFSLIRSIYIGPIMEET